MKKRIFALVLAVLMLSALFTVTAYADDPVKSGTCGEGLVWVISGQTLTITFTGPGSGEMDEYTAKENAPWYASSTSIFNLSIAEGVTSIGSHAFADTKVSSVTIPSTVKKLGTGAFPETLTKITVPCTLSTEGKLPGSVTTIKKSHTLEAVPGKAPTNRDNGTEAYWKCSNEACGKMFSDGSGDTEIEIPATIPAVELDWNDFNPTTGTLTINAGTGTNNYITDYTNKEDTPWSIYSAQLSAVVLTKGIKSVGKNAFPTGVKITAPCNIDKTNLPSDTTYTHDETSMKHYDAKDATETEDGCYEHYVCGDCGQYFDKDKKETTKSAIIIKATDKTPPNLTLVTLGASSVTLPANNISIDMIAYDAGSGVKQAYAVFTNSTKTAPEVTCTLSVQSSDNGTYYLKGYLNFLTSSYSGLYKLTYVSLIDNAENDAEYIDSTMPVGCQNKTINVTRSGNQLATTTTLQMSATTVGYGGKLTGTITLKDSYNNPISGATLDVYVGGTKALTTDKTNESGQVTFNYSFTTQGSFLINAKYLGDSTDFKASEASQTVTVTNVPATGDIYDAPLWIFVAVLAIGVNAWFIINKKRA